MYELIGRDILCFEKHRALKKPYGWRMVGFGFSSWSG
ncbi:Uncharacterised protein [Yersinia frederiksenii]|nr:Uncharacterised protein [Yersinia frederiksenii]CNI88064.1 Uncharacterised protein [Yersinia frederiksenii]CNK45595.1 Uncharacterised protein [Yersinia frederiksenii]